MTPRHTTSASPLLLALAVLTAASVACGDSDTPAAGARLERVVAASPFDCLGGAGTVTYRGTDTNGNGVLDDAEIDDRDVACDGTGQNNGSGPVNNGEPLNNSGPVNNSGPFNNAQPSNNGWTRPRWRFVLVEDRLRQNSGEFPGVDIDAIELVTEDGRSHFVTTIEDFNLGGGSATDITQLFGPPDSFCDASSGAFVSLGGRDADGYVVVGFSTAAEEVTFGAGSTISVYELGFNMCSQFDNDPYDVSVSVSWDRDTFVEIGSGEGLVAIPVTVDP